MSRVDEMAKALGCTGSNVCYLLRKGRIKGTRTPSGWEVTDEAIHEYLNTPTPVYPRKLWIHKGQQFGYWKLPPGKLLKKSISVQSRKKWMQLSEMPESEE